jgi:hypothetical protein
MVAFERLAGYWVLCEIVRSTGSVIKLVNFPMMQVVLLEREHCFTMHELTPQMHWWHMHVHSQNAHLSSHQCVLLIRRLQERRNGRTQEVTSQPVLRHGSTCPIVYCKAACSTTS